MSGIFSGLSTPAWLSPLDTEEANTQYAESLGRNFSESFNRAKELRERRPEMALQIDSMKQQMASKAMDILKQKNMLDYQTQSKAGEVALSSALADLSSSGDWNNPEKRSKVFDVATKYPALMDTPVWQHTQDQFNKSDKAAADAERYKAQAESAQDRLALSQERIDLERSKADAGPKDVQVADEIIKTENAAKAAEQAGDTAKAKDLRERANLIRDQSKTQEITTGYDDQGRPIVRVGKGQGAAGGPTVGTESLAQQKLIKYQNATQLLNQLEKNLKPTDVGAAGVGGEYLIDRGLAQLDPRFANKSRVANRDALTIAKESLMREVGDDRRFTAQDREDISNALPSNGVFESYPDAMQRIKTVRGIISDRARNYAERTGDSVPIFAQSKDEIVAGFQKKKAALQKAVKLGNLSQEDADSQIKDENQKALDALMKYH